MLVGSMYGTKACLSQASRMDIFIPVKVNSGFAGIFSFLESYCTLNFGGNFMVEKYQNFFGGGGEISSFGLYRLEV